MNRLLVLWLAAQAILLTLMANWHSSSGWPSSVFFGLVSAHVGLAGLWIAGFEYPLGLRLVYGIGWCLFLAFLGLIQSQLNGWELLMVCLHVFVVAGVFGTLRLLRNWVIAVDDRAGQIKLLIFTTRQLFLFPLVCGLAIAAYRLAERSSQDDLLIGVMVLLLVVGGSLVSVVAAAVALSHINAMSIGTGIVILISLALGIGTFTYAQTDSLVSAARLVTTCVVQAGVVLMTLAITRSAGYQFAQR